jgi:hypothetical protein
MGTQDKLQAIAARCSAQVVTVDAVQCCGFAGDRGFTHPELNAHALRHLRAALPPGCCAGYSSSRTCEIGLSEHAGMPYRSFLQLVDACARAPQEEKVFALAQRTAELLGVPGAVARESVVANCDYVGAGYGLPTDGMLEALTLTARSEGLLLDPVYSGKGMAGLIDLVRKGHFRKGQNVVFLHTGGAVGLFGYEHVFTPALAR